MKSLIFIISVIFLIASIKTNGQSIITKNDSIPFGTDSIVIVKAQNFRGNISWQQSFDKINWLTSDYNNIDSLVVSLNYSAYYRAKIVDGNCAPVYSDTVIILVADSIKTLYTNNIFELAYPDSIPVLVYFPINNDTLVCHKINGKYIYQGDIILTQKQINRLTNSKGAGITDDWHWLWFGTTKYWPDNIVYYTMEDCLNDDKRIIGAIQHWEEKTSLKFIKIIEESSQDNYVKFMWDANGCGSNLGMIGNKQEVQIADWASKGNVIHEIGHTIGLIHEQSRNDRDQYIKVYDDNIKVDWKKQYEIQIGSTISTTKFDFGSIMIYGGMTNDKTVAFDITKPVMTKLIDGLPWDAQRTGLSAHDITIVKKMYPPIYPSVITKIPTSITQLSANSGGIVLSQGISPVIARGVCWNTSGSPKLSDNFTSDGTGAGDFTSSLTALNANISYYVRAYATNSQGTSYGNQETFKTPQQDEQSGTFTDPRDGKVYKWVKIGKQTWMAENLSATKYNDGTPIPNVTSDSEWAGLITGAYCWFNNNQFNYGNIYGALYNWYAVGTGKLAPKGWHIPSLDEWVTLMNYLGGYETAGGKLKERGTTHWLSPNEGATNESGFNGLPGGYRGYNDRFGGLGYAGGWHSTYDYISSPATEIRSLSNTSTNLYGSPTNKLIGNSVRCIKD